MKLTRFSFNEITLIGTVSKITPVQTLSTDNAKLRIEFDLVTNDRFRTKDNQWQEVPHYHHCNVIGKQAAQFKEFVKLGSYLWARGSVKNSSGHGQTPITRIQIREWSILSQADIDQIGGTASKHAIGGQS